MNKGIKYLIVGLIAAATTAGVSLASGTTFVTWSLDDVTYLALQGGTTAVNDGSLLEVGEFSVAPTVGSSSLANFTAFATSTTVGNDGSGFMKPIASSQADDTIWKTKQIYFVAFNAPTAGSATQMGIWDMAGIYGGVGVQGNWAFVASTDIPNVVAPELENVLDGAGTAGVAFNSNATKIFGGGVADAGGGNSALQLASISEIPEPSVLMLVGLGLLGAVGLRRRHS